jgi:hypothetical protein
MFVKPKLTASIPTEAQLPLNNTPLVIHPESFEDQVDYYSDYSSENKKLKITTQKTKLKIQTIPAHKRDKPAAVPP